MVCHDTQQVSLPHIITYLSNRSFHSKSLLSFSTFAKGSDRAASLLLLIQLGSHQLRLQEASSAPSFTGRILEIKVQGIFGCCFQMIYCFHWMLNLSSRYKLLWGMAFWCPQGRQLSPRLPSPRASPPRKMRRKELGTLW